MSDSIPAAFTDFGKLVPGFDFLQNLTRQASSSSPGLSSMNHWVAPTLSVEELDKRIEELKSVQFWLDQNATALKATIQAMEVQKMTLATLKGMNVSMAQMAEAFAIKPSAAAPDKPHSFAGLEVPPTSYQQKSDAADKEKVQAAQAAEQAADTGRAEPADSAAGGLIDPLQWWGALTQQFQTIANAAMKEVAARTPAGANDSLAQGFKAASEMAEQASQHMNQTSSNASELMSSALRSAPAWAMPAGGTSSSPSGRTRQPSAKPRKSSAAKPATKGRATAASQGASPGKRPVKAVAKTAAKPPAKKAVKAAGSPTASATRQGNVRSR